MFNFIEASKMISESLTKKHETEFCISDRLKKFEINHIVNTPNYPYTDYKSNDDYIIAKDTKDANRILCHYKKNNPNDDRNFLIISSMDQKGTVSKDMRCGYYAPIKSTNIKSTICEYSKFI